MVFIIFENGEHNVLLTPLCNNDESHCCVDSGEPLGNSVMSLFGGRVQNGEFIRSSPQKHNKLTTQLSPLLPLHRVASFNDTRATIPVEYWMPSQTRQGAKVELSPTSCQLRITIRHMLTHTTFTYVHMVYILGVEYYWYR